MPLGSGNIAFREYRTANREGFFIESMQDFLKKVGRKAIRPLGKDDTEEEAIGWCHPFTGDPSGIVVDLPDASTLIGMRIDSRKIPKTTLGMLVKEELAALQSDMNSEATEKRTPKKIRDAIRERVKGDLLAATIPTTKIIEVMFCAQTGRVFFGSRGQGANERFLRLFWETFEVGITQESICILGCDNEERLAALMDVEPMSFMEEEK